MIHRSLPALAVGVLSLAVAARAQCTLEWRPGDGLPGVWGTITDVMLRDPDGSGPLPARTVVGGDGLIAGRVAGPVVEWDPLDEQWKRLAGDLLGIVNDLALAPNGDLYAAGSFRFANDYHAFARWNGTAWQPLGRMLGLGLAATVLPNGRVALAGSFEVWDAGWTTWLGANLTVWDGANPTFPFGVVDGEVQELLVRNGELLARGSFLTTGGVSTDGFGRWDGTTWWPLSVGQAQMPGRSMALLANGDLVCSLWPQPVSSGGLGTDIATWDGSTWTALPPTGATPVGLLVRANGDLLVGSRDVNWPTGTTTHRIRQWSGGGWTDLPLGGPGWLPLADDANGDLVCAIGPMDHALGIARWNGVTLSALGTGTFGNETPNGPPFGSIDAFARLANGDLVAAGEFHRIGGVVARCVARWDGTTWHPLGSGIDGRVRALAVLPNGDLVAGGDFLTAGGVPASKLARWDGSSWSAIPNQLHGSPTGLVVGHDGYLFVSGAAILTPGLWVNGVLGWDGTNWSGVGNGVGGTVHDMALAPDGSVVVVGTFTNAGSSFWPGGLLALRVARWDGTNWSPLGGSTVTDNGVNGSAYAVTVLPNGDVVVGGSFSHAANQLVHGVARWDGSNWHAMGNGLGTCSALTTLPDGDVLAISGQESWRWDGVLWTSLGEVLAAGNTDGVHAFDLAGADLLLGGEFLMVNGELSMLMARLSPTCAAEAVPAAPGCHGAVLAAATLPWVDSTLRTTATGLPTPALALAATGFLAATPSQPLASLLPEGAPGCDLHVVPDVLQLVAVDAGSARATLFLPAAPALVGLTFHQQVLAFELDGNGLMVRVVATNSLQLRAGRF